MNLGMNDTTNTSNIADVPKIGGNLTKRRLPSENSDVDGEDQRSKVQRLDDQDHVESVQSPISVGSEVIR